MKKLLFSALLALTMVPAIAGATATSTIYVDISATGVADGLTPVSAFTTVSAALGVANDGDTISVAAGTYELSSQLDVTKSVSIVGEGAVTIKATNPSWSTVNGFKHLFGIFAGTEVSPISVSNITFDCDGKCYGVNTYNNAYANLSNVTIINSKGAGLTVNGSTIIGNNLSTSGNAWGAINVDPGSGVLTPSALTISGGTLAEDYQIWSDGKYVGGSATVSVTAAGYTMYTILGGAQPLTRWVNKPLSNSVSITKNTETTYYISIPAALTASVDGDTISVGAGTYELSSQIALSKAVSIVGSGLVTLKAKIDFGTDNSSKHMVNIFAGTSTLPVTISGIVFDCDNKCYGVQAYDSVASNLSNVTIKKSKGAGLTVNSSNVTVSNITTSNNAWGGINVDPRTSNPSVLTVNGVSAHTETGPEIWVDDNTKDVTVTDTNSQYASSNYTHDITITGKIYGLKTRTVNDEAELRAALANTLVSTITLGQDITLAAQLDITREVTLDGANHKLTAAFNNGSVILVLANNVTIKNLVEDGGRASTIPTIGTRGINIYTVTGIVLDNVTIQNNSKNGVIVNGSTVTVNNIVTNNNGWEAINVDLGVGVVGPAQLTVNGVSVHSEVKAPIYVDDSTKAVSVIDTNNQYVATTAGSAVSYYLDTKNVKTSTDDQEVTTSGSVTVIIDIPANTIVVGDTTWDGVITPPTATTTTVTSSGFTTSVTSAIVIGSSDSDLTFTKAVKLTFAGQTGTLVGWYNHAGTFAEITATCVDNTQATNDNMAPAASCKINAGSDLVVWTKHFSTFVTYTQAPMVSIGASGSSSGGGSSSGSGSSVSSNVVAITQATPVTGSVLGVQTGASLNTNSNVKGEVLGATAFNFTRNLKMGISGTDVTELQKFLIAAGFLKLSTPTKYYGALTRSALVKWQAKNKLPATGYFGEMSRARIAAKM